MSNLEVPKCPNCGAVLPGDPGAQDVTCGFCGRHVTRPQIRVQQEAIEGAARLREERVALLRARMEETGTTKTASGWLGLIIVVTCILPVLIPIGMFAGPPLLRWFNSGFGQHPFPLHCETNEELEVNGKTEEMKEPLIAATNCKLRIVRSHLKGPIIVKGGVNLEVTLVDSTLEATKRAIEADANLKLTMENSTLTGERTAVLATPNAKIEASKKSKITSPEVALELESNPEITLEDSTISGDQTGVHSKYNAKIKLEDGGKITSRGVAIDAENNLHLEMENGRVDGAEAAIQAPSNPDIQIRGGVVTSKGLALSLGSNAHVKLLHATITGGRKIGSNSEVDER